MKRHRLTKFCYLTAMVPGLCASAYAQDLSVLDTSSTRAVMVGLSEAVKEMLKLI